MTEDQYYPPQEPTQQPFEQPQEPPSEPKDFKNYVNGNDYVKDNGLKMVSGNWDKLIKILLGILIIACVGLFYLSYNNYYKDEISLDCAEIPPCPECKCPDPADCNCAVDCGDIQLPDVYEVVVNNTNSSS